jgi:hypothetical protein
MAPRLHSEQIDAVAAEAHLFGSLTMKGGFVEGHLLELVLEATFVMPKRFARA